MNFNSSTPGKLEVILKVWCSESYQVLKISKKKMSKKNIITSVHRKN